MRTLLLLGILVWSLTGFEVMAQSNVALRFGEDGKFKIAQFTDLHWDSKSSNSSVTMATIKEVLRTENQILLYLQVMLFPIFLLMRDGILLLRFLKKNGFLLL